MDQSQAGLQEQWWSDEQQRDVGQELCDEQHDEAQVLCDEQYDEERGWCDEQQRGEGLDWEWVK